MATNANTNANANTNNTNNTTPTTNINTTPTKIDLNTVIKQILHYLNPGLKYVIMVCFVVFILSLFFVTSFYKPDVVFLTKYRYIMMIVLPLILLIYLFLRKGNSDLDPKIVMMIGGLIVVIMIILFISYIKKPSVSSVNSIVFGSYIINIIIAAIVLVGLAIGYKVLKNSARRMRGWPGFIVNFLFYIPCLISDFIDYLFSEYKNAPNTVFILFTIELILILAYNYVPKLLKYITTKNGLILQEQPLYLNKSTILSNNSMFMLPNSLTTTLIVTDGSSNTFNSNFGLSMWIYVNNMGLKNTEKGSVLFQIASPNDTNGKPCIRYIGNDQWNFIFSDKLTQSKILSAQNSSYANGGYGSYTYINQGLSPTDLSRYRYYTQFTNNSDYTMRMSSNIVSETFMFLYDASSDTQKYYVDKNGYTYVSKKDTTYNTNDLSFNTPYKNFLDIEDNYKNNTNYTISYTYSYGISDLGKSEVPKTTTVSSISDMINQINKDYQKYLPITQKNNSLFKKLGKDFTFNIYKMFNLVQSITQTVIYKTETNYIMNIPSQKWNHIVFNYYENKVDLFINGNLERSMDLKNNPILQLPTDIISVGDKNGIHGSICNIIYYNIPMTKTKISQIYNTYFMKSPPI
jgi:hypothetical protein